MSPDGSSQMIDLAAERIRNAPERIEDRLIVALDLPDVAAARAIAEQLDGVVSFFKLGYWLMLAPGSTGRRSSVCYCS